MTSTESALRRGLIGICAAIVVGTAVELAMRHHWTQPTQLIAWFSLLLLGGSCGVLLTATTARAVRAVRLVTLAIVLATLVGMWEHLEGNYDAAPLDAVYGLQWDTMSESARWWAALTQAVGPSPVLAPGVLVIAGACLWVATIRHPALTPAD